MRIHFRQGIIALQELPRFITLTVDGNVNFNADVTPTLFTIAHGEKNYLLIEKTTVLDAWIINPNVFLNWLYIDIDIVSSIRTFGTTTIKPTYGTVYPTSPSDDAHFFDTKTNKMMVWDGGQWKTIIRIFAGKLSNGVLNPEGIYSQVNVYGKFETSEIILNSQQRVIKNYDNIGEFQFITEDDARHDDMVGLIYSGVDAYYGVASEPIPKHHCVKWGASNTLELASPSDSQNASFGISEKQLSVGELGRIITDGFIENRLDWVWANPPNTSLFVGENGVLSVLVSPTVSSQKIGHIVNHNTIFLKFQEHILIDQTT